MSTPGGPPTPSGGTPTASGRAPGHATRQALTYCPYCAEETLFPLEEGGWECRSCARAFTVTFLGLRPPRSPGEQVQP